MFFESVRVAEVLIGGDEGRRMDVCQLTMYY